MRPPAEPLSAERAETLAEVLAVILPSTSGAGAREAAAADYVLAAFGRNPERVGDGLRSFLTEARSDPAGAVAGLCSGDAAAQALFVELRALAWEGYLCDPGWLGNRGGAGWKRFGHQGSPKRRGNMRPRP